MASLRVSIQFHQVWNHEMRSITLSVVTLDQAIGLTGFWHVQEMQNNAPMPKTRCLSHTRHVLGTPKLHRSTAPLEFLPRQEMHLPSLPQSLNLGLRFINGSNTFP